MPVGACFYKSRTGRVSKHQPWAAITKCVPVSLLGAGEGIALGMSRGCRSPAPAQHIYWQEGVQSCRVADPSSLGPGGPLGFGELFSQTLFHPGQAGDSTQGEPFFSSKELMVEWDLPLAQSQHQSLFVCWTAEQLTWRQDIICRAQARNVLSIKAASHFLLLYATFCCTFPQL